MKIKTKRAITSSDLVFRRRDREKNFRHAITVFPLSTHAAEIIPRANIHVYLSVNNS